ncbi:MAG: MBL fold metallo-hydrolase [Acidobacteriota bacterium]
MLKCRPSRRDLFKALAAATTGLALHRSALAQSAASIAATKVAENFSLITGAGSNVLLFNSPDGALMVDGGLPERSAELLKFVAAQTGNKPVRVLFNTHWHYESTGSNEALGKAGAKIIAHENTKLWLSADIDHHWTNRTYAPLPKQARPNETFYTDGKMKFGGQDIAYGYLLQAHTDGDIYVHFPGANILMVGDAMSPIAYPLLDWSTGGWINGLVDAQKVLLGIANAETRIIAATGPVQNKVDLQAQFDALTTLKDRLLKAFRQGKMAKEWQTEGLTKEFDAQWGNPEQFLQNAYRGLWGHVRDIGGIV